MGKRGFTPGFQKGLVLSGRKRKPGVKFQYPDGNESLAGNSVFGLLGVQDWSWPGAAWQGSMAWEGGVLMSINRIELQGQIVRAQDFTTIKQNEDNKGMVDQSNFQTQFNRAVDHKLSQVREGDNAEAKGKGPDAREKGSNEYAGDGGRHRRKNSGGNVDGKVVLKGMSGFDAKI